MNNSLPRVVPLYRSTRKVRVVAAALAALVVLAGCNTVPRSGPLPTPTFNTLEIPNATGGWMTYSTSSPPSEVLPTRGRGVKLWFYAPVGSTFDVSLRALDGTRTTLPENHGSVLPPEAGYFQIENVNVNQTPPAYTMYVRAPLLLADPANYDVLVVNKSLRTDVTDSSPMVVALRQRKVFTVTVVVKGNGHVTSNPAGIQCGTAPSGTALTDCSHEFGPGQVSLAPGANNLNTTKFIGWTGNCAPGVQVCTFTLNGMAPISATATFGASTSTSTVSTCPTAPLLPGLKWIGVPDCATGVSDAHPGITHPAVCDTNGYFCCEPGPANVSSPRCGGAGKIMSDADCRALGIKASLRQPGGCYETDSYP